MNRADFTTATNGFPLEADSTLGFMQATYTEALNALAKLAGTSSVIISGCVENGNSVSRGWIHHNGELIKFMGGSKQSTIIIDEVVTQKSNADGTPYDRYFERSARFGTGSNSILWANFKRVGNLDILFQNLLQVVGEDNVILSGCEVPSSLPTGTTQISSGVVIINNKILEVGSYNNSFPVWINEQGEYTNNDPGANSIRFDPYSSRRIEYIRARKSSHPGELKIMTSSFDFFEGSGLGIGPFYGWALADGRNNTIDMRGLFVVGKDVRTTDPGNGIWDSSYRIHLNTGGHKEHEMTGSQPSTAAAPSEGESGRVRATEDGTLDNRPPWRPLLYIQRIFV